MNMISASCVNEVMNAKKSIMPSVGMLGTMFVGSDRYAVVCTEVLSPKRVVVCHVRDDYEKTMKTFNGIQYLTDEALEELIKKNTPTIEKVCENLKCSVEDAKEYVEWQLKENFLRYSLRQNGRWMPMGSGKWGTASIHFGEAENYMDPCF